jgi:hypothetical protein
MKDDMRFITELSRIINGALRLDIDKVRNYTAFLADKLEKAGDKSSAARLRKMLEESDQQLRPAGVAFAKALPVDSDSRFPLIERVNVKAASEPPVILSQEQWDTVNEFLSIAKSHAQQTRRRSAFSCTALRERARVGCASYRPGTWSRTIYARLDGLISSFLGNTSKNISVRCSTSRRTPCILFLDEFDAIAKVRGDTQELGELKRVVNSFIQNLDTLGTQSIVIAATNHEELLDSAIWRRFSYRLALSVPVRQEQRQLMWSQFLTPLQFQEREIELLVDLSDGFSGSDIREVCLRLQSTANCLAKSPELKDAFQVLTKHGDRRRSRAPFSGGTSQQGRARYHQPCSANET